VETLFIAILPRRHRGDGVPADMARVDHSAVAVPVSLIGPFAVMLMLGFSPEHAVAVRLVLAIASSSTMRSSSSKTWSGHIELGAAPLDAHARP